MSNWTALAAAVLAEVGLTFDDVYDIGRPWVRGPVGLQFLTGKPRYAGIYHRPSWDNPTSRQRPLIGLTGPVDSEWMFYILAHECGHVALDHGRFISTPEYVNEFEAERYALATVERHLGRPPHPFFDQVARKHVRGHCWARYEWAGPNPTKGWNRMIVEWCGFVAPEPLVM